MYVCMQGVAEKRRGLGPRNDVLTTCKAVTWRDGQRVIGSFPTLNILIEARSEPEPAEEMIKKIEKIKSCFFVFLAYRICLLVLKLRGKLNRNRLRS